MQNVPKESAAHGTKDFPFAYYRMENLRPGFHVPLHWHDEIEILYIESGSLSITIHQTAYAGSAGDIFLVNPKEIHGMSAEDPSTRYHAFVFPLRFVTFLLRNNSSNDFYQPLSEGRLLLHNHIYFNHISREKPLRELEAVILKLIALQKSKSVTRRMGIQLYCTELLYLLYAGDAFHRLVPSDTAQDINREIITYLQNNYAGKISLHELANTFHMSEKYFSRYFKNNFQLTLTDYLSSLRLENASKLLSETTLPITEIALQCGFNNVSYFIRAFKDAFGCSPLRYRKG